MNSISGIVCYVTDLDQTVQFYESLGFRSGKREADSFTVYVNWFSLEFRLADRSSDINNTDIGSYTCIKVDNADEYYEFAVSKGVKSITKPVDQPSGNREFIVSDPDGYKLVFFQKT